MTIGQILNVSCSFDRILFFGQKKSKFKNGANKHVSFVMIKTGQLVYKAN